jgi:hypothetical protein
MLFFEKIRTHGGDYERFCLLGRDSVCLVKFIDISKMRTASSHRVEKQTE